MNLGFLTRGEKVIVTIEDSQKEGGLASLADSAVVNDPHGKILHFGWSCETFVPHGKPESLREACHLTPQLIAKDIVESLKKH